MAKTTNSVKKSLTFKYVLPDNLRDFYINGAYGGLTPRGEISMHLYCERNPMPINMTHTINKNGSLSKTTTSEYGADVIRLVQSSVIMDVGTAIAIRDWLDDKISEAKKIEEKALKEKVKEAQKKE